MTRKGVKQRPWTISEVKYLLENAGRIPKREICKHLKRSGKAVESMAAYQRRHGHNIDLRHYVSKLEACPACGCMRATLSKHGICEVCRKRVQLSAIHSRISKLLHQLPFEEREKYAETEAETESTPDPMPRAPRISGLSYYKRCKAKDDHAKAMEQWQIRNLHKQIKAAQKRKERIQKKVK